MALTRGSDHRYHNADRSGRHQPRWFSVCRSAPDRPGYRFFSQRSVWQGGRLQDTLIYNRASQTVSVLEQFVDHRLLYTSPTGRFLAFDRNDSLQSAEPTRLFLHDLETGTTMPFPWSEDDEFNWLSDDVALLWHEAGYAELVAPAENYRETIMAPTGRLCRSHVGFQRRVGAA